MHTINRQIFKLERQISFLLIIGLISEWLAAVILAQNTYLSPVSDGGYLSFAAKSKPTIYYFLHAMGICCVILSGLLSMSSNKNNMISKKNIFIFFFLQTINITWTLFTFWTDQTYGIWDLVSATGTFVWLSTIVAFSGSNKNIWKNLEILIEILAYLTSITLLFSMFSENRYFRIAGMSRQLQYFILLWWFGAWLFLSPKECSRFRKILRILPYPILLIAALYIQARSWLILTILLWPTRIIIFNRSTKNKQSAIKMNILLCILVVSSFIAVFFFKGDILSDAFSGFHSRLYEDSRSGQYYYFFKDVSLIDLIFGLGPNATWFWKGYGYYKFFDNAMLWMCFIGGIPLFVSYFSFIMLPGIKVFFGGATNNDGVAASLLFFYSIMSIGFCTYMAPSLTLPGYFVCLLAGRCHAYSLPEKIVNT